MSVLVRGASFLILTSVFIASSGCGGSGSAASGGDTTPPPTVPTITSMIPSLAIAGSAQISMAVQGSNFLSGAVVKWNGLALTTSGSGTALSAIVPQSYLASAETVQITVENPSPGGGLSGPQTFTVAAAPPPTYVRTVAQIPDAKDILADRGLLYLSMPGTDPLYPNSIVSLDPVAASVSKTTPTGQGPYMMSASLDDAHLWVTLDGDYALERFSLPGLTQEFTVSAPLVRGEPQQVVSLDAGAVNPRSAAIVVGLWAIYPPYNGVYIFDDDVQRPGNLPAWVNGGPPIAWARWGADDSVLYGGYDLGGVGISVLDVTPEGISFAGTYGWPNNAPWRPVMDRKRNILYDNSVGMAYDPATARLLGRFDLPGSAACTEDGTLQRYYCATAYFDGSSNVLLYELWVYDLDSYKFIERFYFGWRSSSSGGGSAAFTGQPRKLVRWGNAGLALITTDDNMGFGPSGLFLFDGYAVNPNVPPDVSSGTIGAPCVGETGWCNPF